jgi:hypothetical protein
MPEIIKINAIIFCTRISSPRRIAPRKKATTGIK